jgi:hypothetical protein
MALRQLLEEGHTADTEALAKLSPYQTEHIHRFGNYSLNPIGRPALGAAFEGLRWREIPAHAEIYEVFRQTGSDFFSAFWQLSWMPQVQLPPFPECDAGKVFGLLPTVVASPQIKLRSLDLK